MTDPEHGLVLVERSGRRGRPSLAPPGRCAFCGCALSRYRAEGETLCWTCARTASVLDAAGREVRVALVASGLRVAVSPDPVYRCPECGGLKRADSARCARCRFTAEHPSKPAEGALRGGPCPACGGRKDPKARLCRDCWRIDQQLLFAGNPAITCPECGGPKVRKATLCRRCRNRLDHGTVYLGGRPARLVCPECGGPKKLRRARRCRTCAIRARAGRRSLEAA